MNRRTVCTMRRFILALVLCCAPLLHSADDFMVLKDVKPGMKGEGFTVFENDEIERFEFEVLDIVENFYPQRDVILIHLLGEKVYHTGVVSGMSGSPVYIDEKLVGALAYRIGQFMKDPIAGVTPIHQMLDIFSKEEIREKELAANHVSFPEEIKRYAYSPNEKIDLLNILNNQFTAEHQSITPIETPIIVSGLSPKIYERFSAAFRQSNFRFVPGGKITNQDAPATTVLKPGSAVAASIISGDVDVSAVGTVTYCDEKRVLAFGHPMFNSGAVSVPMAGAKVITTLASLAGSNKYAVATDIIGTIRQDRSSGIMGIIGEKAPCIPVHMNVKSPILKDRSFNFNLSDDRSQYSMLTVFLWMSIINSLETTRLGFGDYSIHLNGEIKIENCDDVILENFYAGRGIGFYDGSGSDASEAAYEIAMTLGSVLMNQFEKARVQKVNLTFNINPGKKAAEIEKVVFSKQDVVPGDHVDIFIQVRPYRGEIFELKKTIQVPANLVKKQIKIAVGGNSEISRWEIKAGIGRFVPNSLDEVVSLLNRRRKNNTIIIQLKEADDGAVIHGKEFPSLPPSIQTTMMNSRNENSYKAVNERVIKEWTVPMDYDIQGGREFKLRVTNQPKF